MYNHCINPTNLESNKIERKVKMEIGFRAGVVSTDAEVFYPYKPGGVFIPGYGLDFKASSTFYTGIYSNIKLTRNISFVPEVNYLRRKSSAALESSTINLDLTFLQIALPIQYNLYLEENAVLSFYGGAGINFLLSNKSGIENVAPKYQEYAEIFVSKTELSVFGGTRMMFKVGENSSFGLDLRYELAFRHVVNIKVFNMYSLFIGPVLQVDIGK